MRFPHRSPAKAGVQGNMACAAWLWPPAFAGEQADNEGLARQ
jgi:hypothetical protein